MKYDLSTTVLGCDVNNNGEITPSEYTMLEVLDSTLEGHDPIVLTEEEAVKELRRWRDYLKETGNFDEDKIFEEADLRGMNLMDAIVMAIHPAIEAVRKALFSGEL